MGTIPLKIMVGNNPFKVDENNPFKDVWKNPCTNDGNNPFKNNWWEKPL